FVVVADLPLETLRHHVEGGFHVLGLGVGTVGLPRRRGDRLHPVDPAAPRVLLGDDLDLETGQPGLDPLEPGELVLGDLPQALGHAFPTTYEDELHPLPLTAPRPLTARVPSGEARVRLTWSLAPHPPAGVIAAHRTASHPLPAGSPPPGAGLTSKPRHAHRP